MDFFVGAGLLAMEREAIQNAIPGFNRKNSTK
jgi:hypothetical protein